MLLRKPVTEQGGLRRRDTFDGRSSKPPSLAIMSQVAKSASAFVRAFLAILVLELEDIVVRLFRPPKLAGVHGDRWTVRLGISVDMRCPPWRLASRRAGGAQLCRAIVANADGDAAAFWFSMPLEISSRSASAKAIEDERQRRITCPPIGQTAKGDMVYGMDCKGLKPENRVENQPNMPPTNMKDTVIPKSGGTQNPEITPTTGVNK
jgi:hypothetical protein